MLAPLKEFDMATTADKLRAQRTKINKTQAQIASEAGMSTVQYNGYENGRHEPSESTMNRLAKALKAKPDDLWYDAVEDPDTAAGLKAALQKRVAEDMGVKVSEIRVLIELA
jgi:transcriptional regulator with XRE-family HTH domain